MQRERERETIIDFSLNRGWQGRKGVLRLVIYRFCKTHCDVGSVRRSLKNFWPPRRSYSIKEWSRGKAKSRVLLPIRKFFDSFICPLECDAKNWGVRSKSNSNVRKELTLLIKKTRNDDWRRKIQKKGDLRSFKWEQRGPVSEALGNSFALPTRERLRTLRKKRWEFGSSEFAPCKETNFLKYEFDTFKVTCLFFFSFFFYESPSTRTKTIRRLLGGVMTTS